MKSVRFALNACLAAGIALLFHAAVFAQSLPGELLDETTIDQDIATVFDLAAQAYPAIFNGGGEWRSHGGYRYKYFSASGVYAGVREGVVYLLGGPFGNRIVQKASVSDSIGVLQARVDAHAGANAPPAGSADFSTIGSITTAADIPRYFNSITLEYGSSFGAISSSATITIDVLGTQQVGSASTDHLRVSIAGNGVSQQHELWVDEDGTVVKLLSNGVVSEGDRAQLLGTSFISSALLALQAGDAAHIQSSIAARLNALDAQSDIRTTMLGGSQVQELTVDLSANGYDIQGNRIKNKLNQMIVG